MPTTKKTLEFDLEKGRVVIIGIDDFSVDIACPTLSLSGLYKAVFEDLAKGEQVEVKCTDKLHSDSESFLIYESIKKIIDDAMKDLTTEVF